MPNLSSIVSRFTDTTILYFEKDDVSLIDGFGKPLYKAPVEVKVRYEEQEKEILLPDGRKVMAHGYLLMSSKLAAGGIIWKGTKAQWLASYAPDRPTQAQGAQELIFIRTTPGIRQLPGAVYEAFF